MSEQSQTVTCEEVRVTCENCGGPIVFRKLGAECWEMLLHVECLTPRYKVTMTTHNPRPLGVITGQT